MSRHEKIRGKVQFITFTTLSRGPIGGFQYLASYCLERQVPHDYRPRHRRRYPGLDIDYCYEDPVVILIHDCGWYRAGDWKDITTRRVQW